MERDREADAEVFRRVTARWGTAYDRLAMPEPARLHYDEIVARAEDLIESARSFVPGLPPIHFDLIINGAVNAFAFREGDRYFIALNTGVIYMLRLVIGRMLADARLFPGVGNPSVEADDLHPIDHYLPDAERMHRSNKLLAPRDPGRRAFAQFLEDQALMFFVGHEITHIAHGHVDYLREKRDFVAFDEVSSSIADEAVMRERQALEQNADTRSIQARIDSLRVTATKPGYSSPPWAEGDASATRLIRDWSVSIGIVFGLFGDERFTLAGLERANYPPFALRRLHSEVTAAWEIRTRWDRQLGEDALLGFRDGREEADEAYTVVLGMPIETDPDLVRAGAEYLMRLQDYWNSELVEKLRPYSYAF